MDIRVLGEQDLPAWADLLAAAFDRSPENMVALLRWLRAGWGLVAYGAWDNDTLAAQYSCLQMKLAVPECDDPLTVGMSVNMATHPLYRGQGLIKHVSTPVYQALRDQGAWAGVGFSNAAGVKVDQHSKGYGYQVIGQLVPSIAIAHPFRRPAADFHITNTCPCPSDIQTTRANIHFNVTPCQIAHRFGQHPFRQYQFGVWQSGETIHGVVVYQETRLYGVPAVSLLAVYGEDLEALLSRWIASLKDFRLIYVLTTPNSPIRAALARLTLSMPLRWNRNPYYLTFKPLTDHVPSSLLDFNQWNCVGGDVL